MKIIIDTSTSMLELGKKDSMLYIVKSIQDYLDFNDYKYEVYDLEGNAVDIQQLDFTANLDFNLEKLDERTILVSDGLFQVEDEIKKGVSIKVGIDADEINLHKITNKVFDSENIIEALETLYYFEGNTKEVDNDEW